MRPAFSTSCLVLVGLLVTQSDAQGNAPKCDVRSISHFLALLRAIYQCSTTILRVVDFNGFKYFQRVSLYEGGHLKSVRVTFIDRFWIVCVTTDAAPEFFNADCSQALCNLAASAPTVSTTIVSMTIASNSSTGNIQSPREEFVHDTKETQQNPPHHPKAQLQNLRFIHHRPPPLLRRARVSASALPTQSQLLTSEVV